MDAVEILQVLNKIDPVRTGAFLGRLTAYDNAVCSAITQEQKEFVASKSKAGALLEFFQSEAGKRAIADFVSAWQAAK